jgi:hypothetical protein
MELQKIREKKAAKEAEAHQQGLESDGHRTDGGHHHHGRRQVSFDCQRLMTFLVLCTETTRMVVDFD